jgi:hypothetical protein
LRKAIKWFLPVVILGGAMVPALFAVAQTEEDPLTPGDHIPICHSGNGVHFTFIEPSATSGGPQGHEQHQFDIFASYFFQQNPPNGPVVEVEGQGDASLIDVENETCLAAGPTPPPTTPPPTEPPPTEEPPTGAPPAAPPEDAAEIATELAETL